MLSFFKKVLWFLMWEISARVQKASVQSNIWNGISHFPLNQSGQVLFQNKGIPISKPLKQETVEEHISVWLF